MDSLQDTAALPAVGFPIRMSTDQSLVGGSPWLIAATHVLHRLLEPRHPPRALSSLVTLNSGLPSLRSSGALFEVEIQTFGVVDPTKTSPCDALLPFVFSCQSASGVAKLRRAAGTRVPGEFCVELIGVEPTTSSLQSWRSTN